ncbi:MAG: S8 family serine peptidase [Pseudomonadota bacterium]
MSVALSYRCRKTIAAAGIALVFLSAFAYAQTASFSVTSEQRIAAIREAASAQQAEAADPAAFRALRDFAGDDLTGKDGPLAKLGMALLLLHHEHRVHLESAATTSFESAVADVTITDDYVLVDLVADSDDASTLRLAANLLGLRDGSTFGRFVSGWLPIDQLATLGTVADLKFAQPVYVTLNVGAVTSQADAAMRADIAKTNLGIDGTGITIGVLSDSFDCLGGAAADVASNDLPTGINVLEEISNCTGAIDEGRAMSQLIHDIAPGSQQAFHTAFNGVAAFANGIIELSQVAGAEVIVDDVGILSQPWFQDGIVAQAVDQVVAGGAAYFSSAGNFGRQSYEADFRASGVTGAFGERHDFDPGPGVDTLQSITVPASTTVRIFFQWDQPFFSISGAPGAATDMDLVIYQPGGVTVIAAGANNNLGGDAFEAVTITNSGLLPGTAEIALERFAGPAPNRLKYAYLGSVTVNDFPADTQARTIFGHANSKGARAVGASFYFETPEFGQDPPLLESFSSREGTTIVFDSGGNPVVEPRLKPEIVGVDGVDNTFFGGDSEGNGFPNFFGTSAAAPNAAAVAALMLETNPGLTPGQLYAVMQESTIDMETTGFDIESGFGLVQADVAAAQAAAIVDGELLSFTSGPNGEPLAGSVPDTLYDALGVTITDSDPGTPGTTTISGPSDPSNSATGIVGSFIDVPAVGGTPTFVELAFSTPTQFVSFSFASPSGSVQITARNAADQIISQVTEIRSLNFTRPDAAVWLGGVVDVTTTEDIALLRVETVPATEGLVVDSVVRRTLAVPIPLPIVAWAAMALLLSILGARAMRVRQ